MENKMEENKNVELGAELKEELVEETVHYKEMSPTRMVVRRFFRSRLSLVGVIMLVSLFLFAFIGPPIVHMFGYQWSETETDLSPTQKRSIMELAVKTTDAEGNEIPVTVTQAEKLAVALNIARYLEANEVLGQAAVIDVADLGNLCFWYGIKYQVLLGDTAKLDYKIQMVKSAIDSGKVGSGIMDATLTVQTDGIICRDFE